MDWQFYLGVVFGVIGALVALIIWARWS